MKQEESITQRLCVKWFRLQFPEYSRLLFAVPNGGARNVITGRILKAEGVVAGVADLILLVPNSKYHALCVEMKTSIGRQSPAQKEWQDDVQRQGYMYVVARSLNDFRLTVNNYLKQV